MPFYHSLTDCVPESRAAVACGFFDGLHIGHAAVIGRAVSRAETDKLIPGVFTFTMHGGHPEKKCRGCEIITPAKKDRMLEKWGVKQVLSPDFSEFSGFTPEQFVDHILIEKLGAAVICCGGDFRFGFHAAGDVELLRRLCDVRGVEVDIVPEVDYDGERVSSTRIRALLGAGEVEDAAHLLGRAFSYDFTVISGKRLGRTIDFPTINQAMPTDFVRLRHGVYAAAVKVDGILHPAVTNIGLRPTVENTSGVNSETYIIDYSGDLYGQNIEVRLLRFLRPEEKFASVEILQKRIRMDAQTALAPALAYIASKTETACG